MATAQGSISVSITQIGTGVPLPAAQIMLIGVKDIKRVALTQLQTGGPNLDRFLRDPTVQAATYSRIEVQEFGKELKFFFSSDTVAQVQAKINA